MTDEEIVKQLRRNKTKALSRLIDKYACYVSSILRRILPNRTEDQEELAADVFYAVWENRDKLRSDQLKGYIGSIARNKAFNLLRTDKSTLPLEEDMLIFDDEDVQQTVEQKDIAARIDAALDMLEPTQKELFVRYYYYGFTVAQAAEEMGINPSTAKTWLSRGRAVLKDILSKEDII